MNNKNANMKLKTTTEIALLTLIRVHNGDDRHGLRVSPPNVV